ncbi:hypothetical protein [Streptomyces sp. NPDC059262]|uniref:hypothetical protein n=1 Tax=Streptomyces sp. NPDC059262 TaxID=3346797 RepID=UPI0036BCF8FF
MPLRLACLSMSNAFTALRLLPMSDGDKDAEILVLRHQLAASQGQLQGDRVRFAWQSALRRDWYVRAPCKGGQLLA